MEIRPRQCPNCEGAVIYLQRLRCGECGSELVEIEPIDEYEIEPIDEYEIEETRGLSS